MASESQDAASMNMDEKYVSQCVDGVDISASQDLSTNSTAESTFTERLCLKIDIYVLIPMFFLNLLSLMGRTNIGAALVQKLVPDLHLGSMDVFLAVAISTAPIIVLDIPSQLLMRFLRRRTGLPHIRYLCALDIGLGQLSSYASFICYPNSSLDNQVDET